MKSKHSHSNNQDQTANSFIQSLKFEDFRKLRMLLGVKGACWELNLIFLFFCFLFCFFFVFLHLFTLH